MWPFHEAQDPSSFYPAAYLPLGQWLSARDLETQFPGALIQQLAGAGLGGSAEELAFSYQSASDAAGWGTPVENHVGITWRALANPDGSVPRPDILI